MTQASGASGLSALLPPGAEPFAFGRDADLYAVDDRWVLRRYRNGHPVRDEATYMRHVAKHGFPVPEVREVDGPDMVLQRLVGPTLADSAISGNLTGRELGEIHAELHRQLQAIPAPSGTPGCVVVHGDLHPLNVIATANGPVVIDWCNAHEGSPAFDVATTAIICAQVAVDPAYEELAPIIREALAAYLANSIDPTPDLSAAFASRARDANVSDEERGRLPAQEALIRALL
jgi:aminoglycoside phosphotransferase (APT) family kinase protein